MATITIKDLEITFKIGEVSIPLDGENGDGNSSSPDRFFKGVMDGIKSEISNFQGTPFKGEFPSKSNEKPA